MIPDRISNKRIETEFVQQHPDVIKAKPKQDKSTEVASNVQLNHETTESTAPLENHELKKSSETPNLATQQEAVDNLKDRIYFLPTFPAEIREGAQKMQLQKMSRDIQLFTSRPDQSFHLTQFGESNNPVAKMKEHIFFEKSKVEEAIQKFEPPISETNTALLNFTNNAYTINPAFARKYLTRLICEPGQETVNYQSFNRNPGLKNLINAVADGKPINYKRLYPNLSPKEIYQRVELEANLLLNEYKQLPESEHHVEAIQNFLTELKMSLPPEIDLNKAPVFLSTDELMSGVRTFFKSEVEWHELSRNTPSYITENEFNTLLKPILSREILPPIQSTFQHLRHYVSSYDVLTEIPSQDWGTKILKEASKNSGLEMREFALKMGAENHRELLGMHVLDELGLSKFVIPKSEVEFSKTYLSGAEAKEMIGSSWLEGGELFRKSPITQNKVLQNFLGDKVFLAQSQHKLNLARMENQPEENISKLEEEVSDLEDDIKRGQKKLLSSPEATKLKKELSKLERLPEEKLGYENSLQEIKEQLLASPEDERLKMQLADTENELQAINKKLPKRDEDIEKLNAQIKVAESNYKALLKGIRNQAFIDLLFCSADSHMGQYLVKEGEVYNVDFARHLVPENFEKEGETYGTFRSALLEHPAVSQPLSQEEVNTMKQAIQNFSKLQEKFPLRDLEVSERKINTLNKHMDRLKNLEESQIKNFAEEMKAAYGSEIKKTEPAEIKKELTEQLKKFQGNEKIFCFQNIHPIAFKEMSERVSRLENYLAKCDNEGTKPTILEATFEMYPNIKPFVQFLKRSELTPFDHLSVGLIKDEFQYRSFEKTLKEASSEGMASPQEIKEMTEALERMKTKRTTISLLQTTMDIRF